MKRIYGLAFVLGLVVASCGFGPGGEEKQAKEAIRFPVQDMMDKLIRSMDTWRGLNQAEKEKAVEVVMGLFRERENTAILKSPDFYAKRVDEALAATPDMAGLSLPTMVKLMAVMEYDFFNGQDKDELARQVLGEKMYEENKKRLGGA
jgi:hypothetical protein